MQTLRGKGGGEVDEGEVVGGDVLFVDLEAEFWGEGEEGARFLLLGGMGCGGWCGHHC